MLIKNDELKINTAEVDSVGGAKPEAEERPALRVLTSEVTLTGTVTGPIGVTDKVTVEAETTAGDAADAAARQCAYCVHFDRAGWRQRLEYMKRSADPFDQQELNDLRGHLLESQNASLPTAEDDDRDVEATLQLMGQCTAFTHLLGEPCYTTPWSRCPAVDPNGVPLPAQFQPRSREAQAAADAARDEILRKASRK